MKNLLIACILFSGSFVAFSQTKEQKYLKKGKIEKAIEVCHSKAYAESEEKKRNCLNTIGNYFLEQNQPMKALEHYDYKDKHKVSEYLFDQQRYQEAHDVASKILYFPTLRKLSYYYYVNDDFEKSYELANQTYTDTIVEKLAKAYFEKGSYDKAIFIADKHNLRSANDFMDKLIEKQEFDKVETYLRKYRRLRSNAFRLSLARGYMKIKEYKKSEEAIRNFDRPGYSRRVDIYQLGKEIQQSGDTASAIPFYKLSKIDSAYYIGFVYSVEKGDFKKAKEFNHYQPYSKSYDYGLIRYNLVTDSLLKEGRIELVAKYYKYLAKEESKSQSLYTYDFGKIEKKGIQKYIETCFENNDFKNLDILHQHFKIGLVMDQAYFEKALDKNDSTLIETLVKYGQFCNIPLIIYNKDGNEALVKFLEQHPEQIKDGIDYCAYVENIELMKLLVSLAKEPEDLQPALNIAMKYYSRSGAKWNEPGVALLNLLGPKLDGKKNDLSKLTEHAIAKKDTALISLVVKNGVDPTVGRDANGLYFSLINDKEMTDLFYQFPSFKEVADKHRTYIAVPESVKEIDSQLRIRGLKYYNWYKAKVMSGGARNEIYGSIADSYSSMMSVMQYYVVNKQKPSDLTLQCTRSYLEYLYNLSYRLYLAGFSMSSPSVLKMGGSLIFSANVIDMAKQSGLNPSENLFNSSNNTLKTAFPEGNLSTYNLEKSSYSINYLAKEIKVFLEKIKLEAKQGVN